MLTGENATPDTCPCGSNITTGQGQANGATCTADRARAAAARVHTGGKAMPKTRLRGGSTCRCKRTVALMHLYTARIGAVEELVCKCSIRNLSSCQPAAQRSAAVKGTAHCRATTPPTDRRRRRTNPPQTHFGVVHPQNQPAVMSRATAQRTVCLPLRCCITIRSRTFHTYMEPSSLPPPSSAASRGENERPRLAPRSDIGNVA